ncbi:beta-microseminoprotein A1-like [Eleutherodactylus coqui]|uniref:Beta-microseminoprotein n=1 Tax=Eleutherodactylus coqui TaxID=57060 RepID=A0A8J6KAZ9_ELECQ|nr:hypothetical protein GDO78_008285 [Eleutherodactylus coqui]
MMKYLLLIAVFGAGIFVDVCNGACITYGPKGPGGPHAEAPKGCTYEEVLHEYDSRWRTQDCLDCDCNADGSVRCCQAYGTPVDYDEKNCIKIWDQEACMFHVVRRNNRRKTCKHAMVG